MKKRIIVIGLTLAMIISMAVSLSACAQTKGSHIILATTTSPKDSGLLDAILPVFEKETGLTVEVIAVGSGEAMVMGENGEADVLLVHSPEAEKEYVANGHSDEDGRMEVMYNDFVVIGPSDNPAGIDGNDVVTAFTAILKNEAVFISRADDSGTHKKELKIWEKANLDPEGDWYVEAAAGMGDVITMADEKMAYALSDRGTWMKAGTNTDLTIICENDPSGILSNQYSVICVNPEKSEYINHDGAKAFQTWMVSETAQNMIGEYGVKEYGMALFIPNAK